VSPLLAYDIVLSAAVVVLYLGLAATLREVRTLRGTVLGQAGGTGYAGQPDIRLGPPFQGAGTRIVVAADSGCALCLAVIERLAARGAPATVLTHEPAAVWEPLAHGLPVVSDRESWRAVAHLSPPVLLLADGAGAVGALVLPAGVGEVDGVLAGWTERIGRDRGAALGADPGS
jgi:hypothetical protein